MKIKLRDRIAYWLMSKEEKAKIERVYRNGKKEAINKYMALFTGKVSKPGTTMVSVDMQRVNKVTRSLVHK